MKAMLKNTIVTVLFVGLLLGLVSLTAACISAGWRLGSQILPSEEQAANVVLLQPQIHAGSCPAQIQQ